MSGPDSPRHFAAVSISRAPMTCSRIASMRCSIAIPKCRRTRSKTSSSVARVMPANRTATSRASRSCFESADHHGGVSINRFCSSGLQSIAIAANQIASGQTHVAMAGGVDSISMRTRQEAGKSKQNKRLVEEKPAIFMAMGNTAEVVARRYQVTRETQDEYALQSQQRYARLSRRATSPKRSCR